MPFPPRKGPKDPNKPKNIPLKPPVLGGLVTGRKTTYTPECDELVRRMRLLGSSVEKIALVFGVEVSTIYQWAKKHPSFNQAYARGGEVADQEVIDALRRRAVGYEAPTQKAMIVGGIVEIVETTTHIAADPRAAEFWLINRRPADWKSKQQEDNAGVTVNVVGGFQKKATDT